MRRREGSIYLLGAASAEYNSWDSERRSIAA
jgi:hypothetical protein